MAAMVLILTKTVALLLKFITLKSLQPFLAATFDFPTFFTQAF